MFNPPFTITEFRNLQPGERFSPIKGCTAGKIFWKIKDIDRPGFLFPNNCVDYLGEHLWCGSLCEVLVY